MKFTYDGIGNQYINLFFHIKYYLFILFNWYLAGTIPKLSKLQRFYARNSNVIDDNIIGLLAKSCPDITLIDIGFCTKITDKIADHIKDLKICKLNVSHTPITDEFLKTISQHSCIEYLDDLNISYSKVTAQGLSLIRWDKIKYIGFEGCNIDGKFI